MTDEQLTVLVREISIKQFNKPFLHIALFNSRLRTTGGRYLLSNHHIEVNRKYLDAFGMEELEGIIKHELCHYHLHIEGKGYKHGDRDFKELLKKTDSPRYCNTLPGKYYVYECTKCGIQYKRKRKINTRKYCCSKCSGRILKK
ncbi:MAG TPA: SprT family protein [Kurthia sp.]